MPEHLRALVVLLALATVYWYFAQRALTQLLPMETFKRWRNLWFFCTLVLFLSHSIWLTLFLIGIALILKRRSEAHVMGLYFVLLFVSPPAPAMIPGLGIIDHLWVVDHYRLLALTLLLPTALVLYQRKSTARIGSSPVDHAVLGYFALMSLLAFRDESVTSGMRAVLSLVVDILLPYYVASRSIQDKEGFKQAMAGFMIGAMVLSLVLIFEVLRQWKLYSAVLGALGLNPNMFGGYLLRSGLLRPNASVGNSIVAGYTMVVAFGFYLYLKEMVTNRAHRWLGGALLVAGIVASLSRGPWVGAALLVVVYIITGSRAVKKLSMLAMGGLMALLILSSFPKGEILIDLLPVIGESEQGNVEYRADLLTAAIPVIERTLLFGSSNYMEAPELQVMRQGEGIIDVVNTYVGVALYSGITGLLLFSAIFVSALRQAKQGIRQVSRLDPESAQLGRALFSTLLAIAFMIYTVSSIIAIATVYWAVIGVAVSFCLFAQRLSLAAPEPSNP
ncbi:O-antigen ligase family protein [Hydrogenophaga sp. XSHU_21]